MKEGDIIILGSSGAVGGFCYDLFKAAGYKTLAIDIAEGPRVVDKYLDLLDAKLSLVDVFRTARAVVFALPETTALAVLRAHINAIPFDSIIINTCSVQEPFHLQLRQLRLHALSVGINPMFSPSLGAKGRPVIVSTWLKSNYYRWLDELLIQAGMQVEHLPPDEHDRVMASCQCLPHALLLAYIGVVAESSVDLGRILRFAPPPMQAFMALAARLLSQEPTIYWDIQKSNEYAATMREKIHEGLNSLEAIIEGNRLGDFVQTLARSRERMQVVLPTYVGSCEKMFEKLNDE